MNRSPLDSDVAHVEVHSAAALSGQVKRVIGFDLRVDVVHVGGAGAVGERRRALARRGRRDPERGQVARPVAEAGLEAVAEERHAPVGLRAEDPHAGRAHVHAGGAVVGERSPRAALRHRGHADQVRLRERAGRVRDDVVVEARVAGRRHHHGVVRVGHVHGGGADRVRAGTAQAEIDHVGAVLRREDDAVGHVGGESRAGGVKHAHGHDLGLRRHPGHAQVVVGHRRRGARHVRAVELLVVGVVVAVHEVLAVDAAGAGPKVGQEVGVGQVHARVHHGDHLSGPARAGPGGQRVHVGRRIQVVLEPPEIAEEGVGPQ